MTAEEERELLTKVREIHAAMLARRAVSAGSPRRGANSDFTGETSARSTPAAAQTSAKHDPNDPVVKFDPRGWKGDSMIGRRFSQCPPQYLGQLSHLCEAFAQKNEDAGEATRAGWDRDRAEAARKWRAKLEAKASGNGELFESREKPMTQEEMDEAF